MGKIVAFVMSLVAAIPIYFGTAGSPDYTPTTGFKSAVEAFFNMGTVLNTKYTGTVSDESWDETQEYSLEDTVVLKKEKGKDFVILNLSDVHFADYDIRTFMTLPTTAVIKQMLANVMPDLITVSGDIFCTKSTHYSVRLFTDLMESFGIPWAPIFGNHDAEGNCDANFLADIMMSAPNCIMKKGDPEMGVGNYIINIAEENCDGSMNVVESLIMMDWAKSEANEKQTKWFSWAADGINRLTNSRAEVTLITHIPLPEYQYAYNLAWDKEKGCWREGYEACGEANEKIAYKYANNGTPVQEGFFNRVKEAGTKYVFCGHDHRNNFSLVYEGVRLSYFMKVGHASGVNMKFNGGTEIRIGGEGIKNIKQKTAAFGPVITLEDIII